MMVTEELIENTHSWVKQAATYPEEHPCIDSKTEAEAQTDVEHFVDGRFSAEVPIAVVLFATCVPA